MSKISLGHKKLILYLLMLASCSSCYSELHKNMVPQNLNEAIAILDQQLDGETKQEIKETKRSELTRHHLTFGMWLRNEYGLWHDSDLAVWFNKNGVYHPDDMSYVIIRSYWAHLNQTEIPLKELVTELRERYELLRKEMGGESGIVRDEGTEFLPLPDPSKVSE